MSEWNKKGVWTGITDIDLAPEGVIDSERAGRAIADITVDKAYVSGLRRAQQTLEGIMRVTNHVIPFVSDNALNERDYGEYTGKNKWEVQKQVGEQQFEQIRRGWDVCVPGGETLKDVYARIVPYFEDHILPDLKAGKNILIVAHGNSLRALIKYLEHISDEEVCNVELGVGEVLLYSFDTEGKMISKEIRAENDTRGKV